MTSLPPTQSPNPVPAAAVPKPDPDESPTPWLEVVAMFKTTSTPKPATPIVPIAPLIAANTTLEQVKETVLMCWLAMGGEEDELRRRCWDEDEVEWQTRDEPSDDLPEWCGVTVEGGRVTKLEWAGLGLTGTIPAEIVALSALTHLDLGDHDIMDLRKNSLSGIVPYSLSNLLNLEFLHLSGNNLSNEPYFSDAYDKKEAQYCFNCIKRIPTIRLLNYGIAITKKRQVFLGRRVSPRRATPPPHPFFAFLADHEHGLTDLIMSFLDLCYCCNEDRTVLLKCWKSLGGAEDELRRGYGDDVARWMGVTVEGGRVMEVNWENMGLKGNLPSEIGELDGLRVLWLEGNQICGHLPSEIGKLTSLTVLALGVNHLADLPRELGNLHSLTDLYLQDNRLSVLPSTLANLTNLSSLDLEGNNFTTNVPSHIFFDKVPVQTFLATLMSTDQN